MPSSTTTGVPAAPPFVCACEHWARPACRGWSLFAEHEGKQYCVLHHPGEGKAAAFKAALESKLEDGNFNFHAVRFPDEVDLSHFEFDAPANFRAARFGAGAKFISAKFGAGADFRRATFGAEADFSRATFGGDAQADFSYARFGAVADFVSTTFGAAVDFSDATFSATVFFNSSTFGAAPDFRHAKFRAEVDFRSATFGAGADFRSAAFSAGVDFRSAALNDYVSFAGSKSNQVFGGKPGASRPIILALLSRALRSAKNKVFGGKPEEGQVPGVEPSLYFQLVRIEKPERISFRTLALRPHWFVGVDARKFEFIDVNWNWRKNKTRQELESLKKKVPSEHHLLSIACRNLAFNAQDTDNYEDASRFRYMAMDAQRLEHWRGFTPLTLRWWYWVASGYGERVGKALAVLLGVWLFFAVLYTWVCFSRPGLRAADAPEVVDTQPAQSAPLPFTYALHYSLAVMALQKPDPRPATNWAHGLVLLETILGPLQAALLALALRRKFMR